jgi:23S rRNA (cytosine1962-C5)-methyltransferase
MRLALTGFKHVGVFPEQAANWEFIYDTLREMQSEGGSAAGVADAANASGSKTAPQSPPKVLNLFAYTGGATLAARSAGADVTHVDAVRQTVNWAKDNAELSGFSDGSAALSGYGKGMKSGAMAGSASGSGVNSGGAKPGAMVGSGVTSATYFGAGQGAIPGGSIRWIVDDALKFVRREVRRGAAYDGIVLDPPAYGRGPDGEKWVLEQGLDEMLGLCAQLLKPRGFLVLNLYSMGLSALLARTAVHRHFFAVTAPDPANASVKGASLGAASESKNAPQKEQFGELYFTDRADKDLPLGVYYRFVR